MSAEKLAAVAPTVSLGAGDSEHNVSRVDSLPPVASKQQEEKLYVVLSRLEKVWRRKDDKWSARCPAHHDRSPSLTIRLGDRWINLHCFAGCTYDSIRLALGLEWKDLVVDGAEAPKPRRRSEREHELTAMACALRLQNEPAVLARLRWKRGWAAKALELLSVGWDGSRLTLPVRTAESKLHDTLRYDPFAGVVEPDEVGLLAQSGSTTPEAWIAEWSTGKPAAPPPRKILAGKGKARLPWPAPESVDTDTLLLVEGEGTAISLRSIGILAVALPGALPLSTNVASPGNWRGTGWHRKWAERFTKFRYVVCLPDCDGPGRALMGAARYDLQRAGVNVSIVDLGPKRWDGYDIGDFLRGAYDGPSRLTARNIVREIVAEEAEVLVA